MFEGVWGCGGGGLDIKKRKETGDTSFVEKHKLIHKSVGIHFKIIQNLKE